MSYLLPVAHYNPLLPVKKRRVEPRRRRTLSQITRKGQTVTQTDELKLAELERGIADLEKIVKAAAADDDADEYGHLEDGDEGADDYDDLGDEDDLDKVSRHIAAREGLAGTAALAKARGERPDLYPSAGQARFRQRAAFLRRSRAVGDSERLFRSRR